MAQSQSSTLVLNALDGFSNLPMLKQAGLLVAIAASIAIGVAVALWAQQPEMRPLYTGLDQKDAGEIVEALAGLSIPYEIDPASGTILVDATKVYDARLKLAAQGLPHSVSNSGFESLGKETNFGTSQFMEQAMFRHALENELSRTIASMDAVRSARVHLAVPKQSVFLRDNRTPSASVLVDLYSGRSLSKSQVAAITNLVASSVPDMQADDVTLVDQKGHLLSEAAENDISNLTAKQLEIQKQVESAYVKRIVSLLSPILGESHVKAEVNADLDFTASEKTSEIFDPGQQIVRSVQSVEEVQNSKHGQGGIPGAASNAPDANQNDPNNKGQNGDVRKRDIRSFEIGKTISHTVGQPWAIKRISVAIAVDDIAKADARGNAVKAPVSEEKLQQISNLVKEAVGFNQTRGDSVNVINLSFAENPEGVVDSQKSILEEGWIWEAIHYLVAAAGFLFVVFGLLRPLLKTLAGNATKTAKIGASSAAALPVAEEPPPPVARPTIASTPMPEVPRIPEPSNTDLASIEVIKNMVQQDPARVARVVMNWVGNDDE
jgi:flagellar M-ring protein FliF